VNDFVVVINYSNDVPLLRKETLKAKLLC